MFQIQNHNEVLVVSLEGSLDISIQKKLNDELQRFIDKKEKDIVLDFHKVTFIDSSCLGTLAAVLKALRKDKGDLKLARLADDVLSIFQITRLNTVFGIFDTIEEAVESYFKTC